MFLSVVLVLCSMALCFALIKGAQIVRYKQELAKLPPPWQEFFLVKRVFLGKDPGFSFGNNVGGSIQGCWKTDSIPWILFQKWCGERWHYVSNNPLRYEYYASTSIIIFTKSPKKFFQFIKPLSELIRGFTRERRQFLSRGNFTRSRLYSLDPPACAYTLCQEKFRGVWLKKEGLGFLDSLDPVSKAEMVCVFIQQLDLASWAPLLLPKIGVIRQAFFEIFLDFLDKESWPKSQGDVLYQLDWSSAVRVADVLDLIPSAVFQTHWGILLNPLVMKDYALCTVVTEYLEEVDNPEVLQFLRDCMSSKVVQRSVSLSQRIRSLILQRASASSGGLSLSPNQDQGALTQKES